MKKKLYGKYYWYQEKPWWKKVNVNKSLNDTVCGVFMNETVWCFLTRSIQLHDPSWECPVTELELK